MLLLDRLAQLFPGSSRTTLRQMLQHGRVRVNGEVEKDAKAALAQLGPEQTNTAYTGRPDDRPWSERHKALLWLAMVLAVVVLAVLAVRGFKSDAVNAT